MTAEEKKLSSWERSRLDSMPWERWQEMLGISENEIIEKGLGKDLAQGRFTSLIRVYANGDDILVVDLHADELLETTAGMGSADILNYQLDYFRRTLEENKHNKGKRIVFIHGKGEGVLRHALVNELRYRYKNYRYQDASFQEYGYGATQVTIR